jgi:hypothetical protein
VKLNKTKSLKIVIILLLILSSIGFVVANKVVGKYGYTSVFDLIQTYRSNYELASQANVKELNISLSNESLEFIKEKRQVALERGLQVNEGDSYVNCKLGVDSESTKAKMRLKGHMTDHLEGDKWSFRVKSKDTILGMYRFSLQHPGTRNYVYEWVYHEMLAYEGVINLYYDFVNLKLNEKDLGVYAVEEHFGQHVLKRNNRPKGAIIRWNPNLYWEGRIDGYHKIYLSEEYSSYQSSFAEPYDKGMVIKDKEILENYEIAAGQLEMFRTGKLKTSEVFDVEKMAKFHAIIDLVGGQHSLDWSDVKFYYNSVTEKIEPVGYESFSIRETNSIAGQINPEKYEGVELNYHAQLFSDPVFFESYIRNLERIADEKYLNEFYEKIESKFKQKIGIVAKEWPYRKFSFDGYYKNIRLIRHNLALPKAFHAFTQVHNKDSISICFAPVSDFPIEIIGIKKKDEVFSQLNNLILKPKAKEVALKYFYLTFKGDFTKIKDVVVLAKIPGSKNIFEIELAEYPKYKEGIKIRTDSDVNMGFDTTIFSMKGNVISFKNQTTILKSKVVIPDGFKLVISPNQKLVIQNQLIINGEIYIHGLKDFPVKFETVKNGICKVYGVLESSNSVFTGDNCFFTKNAKLSFYHCQFYDVKNVFVTNSQSQISFKNCDSGNVKQLAVNNESNIIIENCNFKNGNVLLVNNASNVKLTKLDVKNYKQLSKLNYQSSIQSWSSNFVSIDTLFVLSNSSNVNIIGGELNTFDIAFLLNPNSVNLLGESSFKLYKSKLVNYHQIDHKL